MIAVFAALPAELAGLARRLDESRTHEVEGLRLTRGTLGGRQVALVLTGVGMRRAARAARVVRDGLRPREVLSIGYAGGLAPDLAQGALVAADRLLGYKGDPHGLEAAPALDETLVDGSAAAALAAAAEGAGASVRSGAMLTVRYAVTRVDVKRRLGEWTGALCCEMESQPIAAAFAGSGARVAVLRMVTDTADHALPDLFHGTGDEDGPPRGLARFALRHPVETFRLLRLGRGNGRRYRALEDVVEGFVRGDGSP